MRTVLLLPGFGMLAGCQSGPPPPHRIITHDLRPKINQAFQHHNRETSKALRNLSNTYETGIRAYQQKRPHVLRSYE